MAATTSERTPSNVAPFSSRYQIDEKIAEGGMAEIFLARARGAGGFEKHVVVKQIRPEYAHLPRFVDMFLDEAKVTAQLQHQGIGQVYDFGRVGSTYFMTMEYLHGVDLRRILGACRRAHQFVPLQHVLSVGRDAAVALHYAHQKRSIDGEPLGIVHRDISLSNIVVTYDGSVKVVDFGVAKFGSRRSETTTGCHKGKLAYMSPEQVQCTDIDHRSDIFSLGIVLYELCTGTRLFSTRQLNDFQIMQRIIEGEIPDPRQRRTDLPDALADLIFRCLATDRDERFSSAGELAEALEDLAAETGSRLSPVALGSWVTEVVGHRREPWCRPPTDGDDSLDSNASDDVLSASCEPEAAATPAAALETVIDDWRQSTANGPVTRTRAGLRLAAIILPVALIASLIALYQLTEPPVALAPPQIEVAEAARPKRVPAAAQEVALAPDMAAPPAALPVQPATQTSVQPEPEAGESDTDLVMPTTAVVPPAHPTAPSTHRGEVASPSSSKVAPAGTTPKQGRPSRRNDLRRRAWKRVVRNPEDVF